MTRVATRVTDCLRGDVASERLVPEIIVEQFPYPVVLWIRLWRRRSGGLLPRLTATRCVELYSVHVVCAGRPSKHVSEFLAVGVFADKLSNQTPMPSRDGRIMQKVIVQDTKLAEVSVGQH